MITTGTPGNEGPLVGLLPAPTTERWRPLRSGLLNLYKFDHQIVETVKFVHDLTYFPSTDDVSDYYLTTTAELRANFTKSMFGTFKTIFSRDTSPAAGRGNSDVKYILGVGIGF